MFSYNPMFDLIDSKSLFSKLVYILPSDHLVSKLNLLLLLGWESIDTYYLSMHIFCVLSIYISPCAILTYFVYASEIKRLAPYL